MQRREFLKFTVASPLISAVIFNTGKGDWVELPIGERPLILAAPPDRGRALVVTSVTGNRAGKIRVELEYIE